jgi:hypothetical protein
MFRRSTRRGISRTSVVVVILSIGLLIALVLPAIQAAREAERRTQCNNNLKQIGIGLRNYHDTYKLFPMGAMHSGLNLDARPPATAALGPSWWYGVLPFTEQNSLFDLISSSQRPGVSGKHEFCADVMNRYVDAIPRTDTKNCPRSLDSYAPDFMRCPSSSLPVMESQTGPICLPSYVGIAGGCDIDPNSQDYQLSGGAPAGLVAPKTNGVYHNKYKGTGAAAGGIVTSSGMLPPCQQVGLADCLDGAAKTMIVAEQSDWLLDQNPASLREYHGDPGWTVGGTGPGGGWLSGTRRVDPVPEIDTPGGPPAVWGADCWNITTVRYPPNFKRVMGSTPLPGCSENHGINNPLQSPHPGGLLVAMADGSVRFVSQTVALEVLLRLAIRNDGVSPPLP